MNPWRMTPVLAGLFLALASPLFTTTAQAADDHPKAYVVLVGVGDYADKAIQPRKRAVADAEALYDLFTDKQYLDTDAKQVKLLVSGKDEKRPHEAATRDNILKQLHWAVSSAGKDDLVVFAFFGQGGSIGDRICLFGEDAGVKDRAKTAVTATGLEKELNALKSQRFVGLIDFHLKGFDAGAEAMPEPNPNDLMRIFLKDEDKDDPAPTPGRVLFLANNGLKPTLETAKNGLFTHLLVEALKGAADKEGYEPDGVVSVDELVEYLSKEMPKQILKLGTTKEEREQVHFVLGARNNHFAVTRNPAAAKAAEERLEKFAKIAEENKLAPDVVEEGKRLLSRMPKLQALQDLRKQYQKLADGTLTAAAFDKARVALIAGTKLNRKDAGVYAAKVMEGVNVLHSKYVKELNRGEMVGWAVRGLYRKIEEKVPADVKDRIDKCKTFKEAELVTLLTDVREKLGVREDLANNKDVDISLQLMLSHLDPHTNYIDKETLDDLDKQMGRYTGIGIKVGRDLARDMLQVLSPIKGSPAYKAGIKTGDLITTIVREVDSDGKKLPQPELTSTKGLQIGDAVKKILGKAGTEVKLIVEREGEDKPREFTLTRGRIVVETVMGTKYKDNDDWDHVLDPASRICYIRLTQFNEGSFKEMKKAIERLSEEKGGIKGLILDMRGNPGGLLSEAVEICDLFIDDGAIVTIKPRTDKEHTFQGESAGSLLTFPMVCMVNGGSASASEIVSACLQDHGRAIVVGERSYGKGSVQNVLKFPSTGAQIKVTTASFWRPSGKNLDKRSTKGRDEDEWGVTPTKGYLVPMTPRERDELDEQFRLAEIIPRRDAMGPKAPKPAFKDVQLEKAADYLRDQIKIAGKPPVKKAG